MKTLAGVVALMAVFTLAICFILIGSISEELKTRLAIDNSGVGSLATAPSSPAWPCSFLSVCWSIGWDTRPWRSPDSWPPPDAFLAGCGHPAWHSDAGL